ncbi:MAG TPA: hypothetical protein VIJ67_02855 [Pseudolabrys sp.]
MTALQFLASLPALLGFTGFVIYYFIQRNQSGDQVTLKIVDKLRVAGADRLPPNVEKLDATSLAKLIDGDTSLRGKISDQDFQLLRDVLHQQSVASLVVYGASSLMFLGGIAFYVYLNPPAKPVKLSNITVQDTNPASHGVLVDLDNLKVAWSSDGDPEDVTILVQEVATGQKSLVKTVRSTDNEVVFSPTEYAPILGNRQRGETNSIRVVAQSKSSSFMSKPFDVSVGITVMAVRFTNEHRIKIAALIDGSMIDFYDFEANLLVWGKNSKTGDSDLFKFGGRIEYGKNDFPTDPAVVYDWTTAKVGYLGPDPVNIVRATFQGR